MGLFSFFDSKPTPAKFAKLFARKALEHGFAPPMHYKEADFQLVIGANGSHVFSLGNVYRDYCNAPRKNRDAVLRHYLTQANIPAVPADFLQARPRLMPSLKPRAQIDYLQLQARLSSGASGVLNASRPLSEDAAIVLAYDGDMNMMYISQSHLDQWGVSFDTALEAALENLRDRAPDRFSDIGLGVAMSQWNDSYDSSRALLADMLFRANGGGEPVVMIPNRGCLLVAPAHSPEAQMLMIATAEHRLQQEGRPVSTLMYRIVEGRLVAQAPADPEVAERLHEFRTMMQLEDYKEQKGLLEQLHAKEGTDLFVASFTAYRHQESGRLSSSAVWSQNVETLLPKTDLVTFYQDGATPEQPVMRTVRWEDMWPVAGHLLVASETHPVRYLTKGFPDDAALAALPKVLEMSSGPLPCPDQAA